jgi:hypothetical protein
MAMPRQAGQPWPQNVPVGAQQRPDVGLPHTAIPPQMPVAELQIPGASALVRLAYLDSGVPLSGGDYTTIIAIHGLMWSAGMALTH